MKENYVSKYCTKCAAKIRSTDNYCVWCGVKTYFEEAKPAEKPVIVYESTIPETSGKWNGDYKCAIHTEGDLYVEISDYRGNNRNVQIPERIRAVPVKEIRENAFASNHSIEKLTLPKKIRKIGNNAFDDCVNLKEIRIPKGFEWNDAVLGNCRNVNIIVYL